MADILAVYGSLDSHAEARPTPQHTIVVGTAHRPGYGLRMILRPGPHPAPGGFGCVDELVIAWIGRWQARGRGSDRRAPVEALARAWQEDGSRALERFQGRLAAVIWDGRTGLLHAVRDRLGLTPMTYARQDRTIMVCTDSEWLSEHVRVAPRITPRRLSAFLMNSPDCGRDDFFEGHYRIRPGEVVCWNRDLRETCRYYWQPDTSPLAVGQDPAAMLLDVLEEVVTTPTAGLNPRLVSMSGGLDSSSLAVLEIRRGDHSRHVPLNVVSMVAPGMEGSDESEAIKEIERALPMRVHAFSLKDTWPLQDLEFYRTYLANGPQFHPEESYIQHYHRWIEARFGSLETLYGHGADDVLLCPRQIHLRWLLRHGPPEQFLALARRMGGAHVIRDLGAWGFERLGLHQPIKRLLNIDGLAAQVARLPWQFPTHWVVPDQAPLDAAPSRGSMNWGQQRLHRLRRWPWELVCRTLDREIRRSGVNNVYPMLDDRFWELCLRIVPAFLARNAQPKAVLRDAMRDLLPTAVLQRPKHGGFDAIVELGLCTKEHTKVEGLFRPHSALGEMGLIDPARFLKIFEQYRSLTPRQLRQPYRGSLSIWQTIAAELWLREVSAV